MADKSSDSATMLALRKKMRGDPLTDEERELIAKVAGKPSSGGLPISQEELAALVEERRKGK
jgi:hypothetical protein